MHIHAPSARMVVLLCGPAGAGKTTAARESGLVVFDRDDPEWITEKQFTSRIKELATDASAQAVVIRAGAKSSARARWAAMVGATHIYVMTLPKAELADRVRTRHRADMVRGLSSIKGWFDSFDRTDNVQDFPGWPTVMAGETALKASEAW